MLGAFILGFALLFGVILLGRWFVQVDPKRLARVAKIAILVIIVVVIVVLAVLGRLGWALGASLALAPILPTLLRAARTAKNYARMAQGGTTRGGRSEVTTQRLRMTLDHDTGAVDGEVIGGDMAGSRLGDLPLADVVTLFKRCRADDDEASVRLLEAYLNWRHPEWQDAGAGSGNDDATDTGAGEGGMSVEQAYRILGLPADAGADDVRAAYRRLIASLHPDHGGSSFLASQVNIAKKVLLDHLASGR